MPASGVRARFERIGGSKRAIYSEFGNKEALFTALVTELADDALRPLHPPEDQAPEDLRDILLRFARRLLAVSTSKNLVGVYRGIITEAYRFPHLARTFYENGPGRAARELRTVLDAAVARGEIAPIDTEVAADHFVGMMRDNLHLQVVLGLRETPKADELRKRADLAVEIFLSGIAKQARTEERATTTEVDRPRRGPPRRRSKA